MAIRWPAALLASILLLQASGCSPLLQLPTPDSGVEGYVLLGPVCPVMQVGVPCSDRPYSATLAFVVQGGFFKVGEAHADARGFYHLALSPGRYVLRPESTGMFPRAQDILFAVQAHQFARLDVTYDSGIR
jgi:hypothetical protein